jgi:hypothetical protein
MLYGLLQTRLNFREQVVFADAHRALRLEQYMTFLSLLGF